MISKRLILFFFILFAGGAEMMAQQRVAGVVRDHRTGEPMPAVNVLARARADHQILHITHTDETGRYEINLPDPVPFDLRFSALGYATEWKIIIDHEWSAELQIDMWMREEVFLLEEVQIVRTAPVMQRGDTIVFHADSFMKGNEQVVQDLLKSLPGFQVDDDGTIRIGQQEIEKIMVEGNDFFAGGYKILSGTMPAHPIQSVELLKNYSENKLLKGIEPSDKIALNLTLKEDYRHIWFGNLLMGYGPVSNHHYDLKAELMNFAKKQKYYLISDLNNTGRGTAAYAASLSSQKDESSGLGQGTETHPFFDTGQEDVSGLKDSRYKANRSHVVSLNGIFNSSRAWNVKVLSLLSWDELRHRRESHEKLQLLDTAFDRFEVYSQRSRIFQGYGKLDVVHEFSEDQVLSTEALFHATQSGHRAQTIFNSVPIPEESSGYSWDFVKKLNYSNRISSQDLLSFDVHLISRRYPQQYIHGELEDKVSHQLRHLGAEVSYLSRPGSRDFLTWRLGLIRQAEHFMINQQYPDDFGEPVSSFDEPGVLKKAFGEWYSQTHYRRVFGNVELSAKVRLFRYSLTAGEVMKEGQHSPKFPIQVNPGFRIAWNPGEDQKMTASYSYSGFTHQMTDLLPVYVRTNYRSAMRGVGEPALSKASTWTISHLLTDWSSGLFIHSLAYLVHFHQTLGTKSQVDPWFTWTEKMWVNDPFLFSLQSSADYFLKAISSNLSVELSRNQSTSKNQFNGQDTKEYVNILYQYGLEMRSGFSGLFNFHTGFKWRSARMGVGRLLSGKTQSREGFMDIYLNSGKRWQCGLQTEWSFLNQGKEGWLSTCFVDARLQWQVLADRMTLFLIGENLLSADQMVHRTVGESGLFQMSYPLMPRRLIFRASFRL